MGQNLARVSELIRLGRRELCARRTLVRISLLGIDLTDMGIFVSKDSAALLTNTFDTPPGFSQPGCPSIPRAGGCNAAWFTSQHLISGPIGVPHASRHFSPRSGKRSTLTPLER